MRLSFGVALAGALSGAARGDASISLERGLPCGPWSGVAAAGRTIAAWSGAHLVVSRDGGGTFHELAGGAQEIDAAAVDPGETVYAARGLALEVHAADGRRALRTLPFSARSLAAGGAWLVAVGTADAEDDHREELVLARSRDRGASFFRVPSPHAVGTWPGCCSENSRKQIAAAAVAVSEDGAIDVFGTDDDCSFAYTPWRYRRRGGRWEAQPTPFDPDEPDDRALPVTAHGGEVLVARRGNLIHLGARRFAALGELLPGASALAFDGGGQPIVVDGRRIVRGVTSASHTLATAPACRE